MRDPAPTRRAEMRRRLAHHALGASMGALVAGLCAYGDRHVAMLSHGPGVHEVAATVVDVRQRGDDRYLVLEYTRRDATRVTSDQPAWYAPDARAGDRIAFLYSDRDTAFARPLNPGERLLRLTLHSVAVALALGALGSLGFAGTPAGRRLDLVRHGERLPPQAPATQQDAVPIGRGGSWPRCRLRAAWYDESLPGWREVASNWRPGLAPEHPPADAVILRRPGTRNTSLPLPPSVQGRGFG
jgi:hypothetical protein